MTFFHLTQEEFDYLGPIGAGTFGTVMRAHWKTKSKDVAIKRLPTLNPEDREVQVLTSLRHRNVIQFFGIVNDNNGYGIVTEIAEFGSLYDYLGKKNGLNQRLDYGRVVMWALDIARGMEYLHFQAPQTVIHRDLKSKNVVINSKLSCKLCDFGSSKFQQNTLKEASTIAGTMAWMAPEVIKESMVTEASDTYSFAIVFWELLTCKVPYHSLENLQVAWLVAMKGERPHLPAECPHKFKVLIQSCWKENPKERPDFQFLVKNLEDLKQDKDLEKKTAVFLDNPGKWQVDIGNKNEKLMKQGNELTDKEKQLQIWERQLMIKEKMLRQKEHRQQSRSTYHSLEKWTPRQVYQWVKELRKGDGDELEDQFIELANRFYAESIDGKALKLLGEEDLVKMNITGLGQRIDLLDAIKELRESNQSLMNFPPLAATVIETTPLLMHQQTLKLAELVLIFGNICRPNPDIPKENRWKLYLELDGDECAIPTVQSITFNLNEKNMQIELNRPPFVMNKWLVVDTPGMVECKVNFDDLIVVTPVDVDYLFTPEIGGKPVECKVELRIKSTSTTAITPQNSLSGSDYQHPLKSVSSLSANTFEFCSNDIPRNSSSSLKDFNGPALKGDWANKGPGSLARMISSQTCPKTIVIAGPMPNFNNSPSSLHPNSSFRSQSSLSHISPRLSSTSRPSSPANLNTQFSSPRTPNPSNPPFRGSNSNSYRPISPSVNRRPYNKRFSLPVKSNMLSPEKTPHRNSTTTPFSTGIRTESVEIHVEGNNDDNMSTSSREDHILSAVGGVQNGRSPREDTHQYSSDSTSVDSSSQKSYRGSRELSRRDSYTRREARGGREDRKGYYRDRKKQTRDYDREYRRDNNREYRRDNEKEYRRDNEKEHRRDNEKEYRRDNEKEYRRDNEKEYRRDNEKEYRRDNEKEYRRDNEGEYRRDNEKEYRRDNEKEYRRDNEGEYRQDNEREYRRDSDRGFRRGDERGFQREDKKNYYVRREDRSWEQNDKEVRRDDKKGDRVAENMENKAKDSDKRKESEGAERNSDSEWTVVSKNKVKTRSSYY